MYVSYWLKKLKKGTRRQHLCIKKDQIQISFIDLFKIECLLSQRRQSIKLSRAQPTQINLASRRDHYQCDSNTLDWRTNNFEVEYNFLVDSNRKSMYLCYFYCIGNRYSVFYVNYIISQLTVRKKKISHIFCCVSSDNESHSSRQPKTTEIWWEVRRIKFAFSWCAKINNSYRFRKPWSKLKILPTYQKILDNENSLAQFFRDMVGEE